ncbi:MAG: DUF5107 domain-containing protein [Clostridia bacterium]|nr:DUF5107 domain-containing protein [Clostridia bacterium]
MKNVNLIKTCEKIPTYIPKAANTLPMFFEKKPYQGASGKLYPIPYSDGITDEKKDVDYTVYTLENEYIYTKLLPEVGGKILRAYDKVADKDFIYYNEVIKPALVGIAGAWISGGIEFNWPQHHRPTTFMPLEAAVEENADGGKTVWMGEIDPLYGMKGMMGVTVDKGRSYIKAKIRLYNRTAEAKTFMWWANMAFPANKNVRTVFPPDVEWVNDHDRRAVLSWPVAKGVYHTARPFNYGEGTDLSLCDSVKVPSSFLISQGQSDMDFVSGYDMAEDAGFVTVANHHIAPGKKMWHWGVGDFGEMWCSNLTDNNGPYIELMTGVYTDNQPDFTWIAPYETKEFEQYWYPVRNIGEVKNATVDAALNLEKRDNEIYVGLNVTGIFKNAEVRVESGKDVIYSETVTLDPTEAYQLTLPLRDLDFNSITASLISEDGKTLVSYKPYIRGNKKPIEPRQPVKRPAEIENMEELYINALHLEQYKQHNYEAKDYYLEGLRRDPMDSRCNTAMSRLALRDGEYERCVEYADKAIARLTLRNMHPTDTEALYNKGIALKYLGRLDQAYDTLWRAAWNYSHRSAAYFALAEIDCIRGDYTEAIQKLEVSLGLNAGHTKARNLRAAILRTVGCKSAKAVAEENAAFDMLDLFAQCELGFHKNNSEALVAFAAKPENILTVLADYMDAGLYESALAVADLFADVESPMIEYYKAYCMAHCDKDATEQVERAEKLDTPYCFPYTQWDMVVLEWVAQAGDCANAAYYLGCIYYDRKRYEDAAEQLERCVSLNSAHGAAWRNLALYYFDKAGKAEKAKLCMEQALKYKRSDPRILFEYQQLLKNMNRAPEERLAVYDEYADLLAQRDDCYLDKVFLTTQTGRYQEAIALAAVKRFHIYEGGEGKLTKLHAWMHVLYGAELLDSGKTAEALATLENGVNMPKSYGEAKTFFNQEAHIYYNIGLIAENAGDKQAARVAFEKAAEYKAACSPISLWRALALMKLGNESEARAVLDEMIAVADNKLANRDLRTYYGVGSPSPMPFEYNIIKQNTCEGSILKAFALLGYGRLAEAEETVAAVRELDPYSFDLYVFDAQKGRINI